MLSWRSTPPVYAPTERVQGDVQRIFYCPPAAGLERVPGVLRRLRGQRRLPLEARRWWDALARSSAEVGLLFTTLMLIVGSLWARPIWGTWWSWDARLTTTLLLWFIYVGYLMLRVSIVDE